MHEKKLRNLLLPITFVLIGLKLTAIIEWSWWGVLSPAIVYVTIESIWILSFVGFLILKYFRNRKNFKQKIKEVEREIMNQKEESQNEILDEN
jgi:hypothetical protein